MFIDGDDHGGSRPGHAGPPPHGRGTLPALGGLLLRHNRRYGGFVVHLAVLVVALGVTGSQAWSVQTETTLKRGEAAELAGYRSASTAWPRARSPTTSR